MPDLLSIVWWRKFYSRVGRGFGWGCMLVFGIPLVIGFGWNQYGSSRNQAAPTDDNAVIAAINGEPVTRGQYYALETRTGGSAEEIAKDAGTAMNRLVGAVVIRQLAKKYGVRVGDADVDRRIADERAQATGKNGSDQQWEEYVSMAHHRMSPSEYRDSLTRDSDLLGVALLDKFKSAEQVTPEDVRNYNQEVQARIVQISYGKSPLTDPKKHEVVLTETQARKKAEDLLAKAKSGADFAAIAKANSSDFTKTKGGDLGFMPEYRKSPDQMTGGPGQEMLASGYGQELADAIHKTPVGQITGIVKTSMFGSNGFAFAKVEARRQAEPPKPDPKNPSPAPPPVTDPKKITEEIKKERATEKLGNEFKTAFKAAKVVFRPEGATEKAYYDYVKAEQLQAQAQQAMMMAQFGRPATDPIPAPAEIAAQKSAAEAELEEQSKKHPDDSTLALLAARNLKTKLDLAPSNEQAALRDRLIAMDLTALKGNEERNIRFDLAQLYRDKGDIASADAAYQKISHLMDIAPGYDTQTLTEEQTARRRLVSSFRAINKPAEADAEQAKIAKIDSRLAAERLKASLQQKAPQMPGNLIAPGEARSGNIALPSPRPSGKP